MNVGHDRPLCKKHVITKQKSRGWSKINIQVHGILWERGNIKQTQMKLILEPGFGISTLLLLSLLEATVEHLKY